MVDVRLVNSYGPQIEDVIKRYRLNPEPIEEASDGEE